MKVLIKTIRLGNFKGCKEKVFELGEKSEVLGANGVGKTTLATSWLWLMADKDYDLHSNPNIRPLDVEECTPRVEVVLDVDGKEVIVAKQQKRTVSKPNENGISKVSFTNSYEVNAVPKSERDFKAYLTELGIDFDLFLPLSHPNVFTSQKATEMRKVLFSMASNKSDYEIAIETSDADDVAKLLEQYTMEEIEALNKATLRKIKEDYGKDGEILRAKIDGLESAKVDIDVAELELQRKALKEKIEDNQIKQDDLSKQYEEYNKISDEIMELKFRESELKREANTSLNAQKTSYDETIATYTRKLDEIGRIIFVNDMNIERLESEIKDSERLINSCRESWTKINNSKFDENSLICSYCGQEYPADKKEQIRAEFETNKKNRLASVTKQGNELKEKIDNLKVEIENLKRTKEENEKLKAEIEKNITETKSEYDKLPETIDITETDDYKAIQAQINEKELVMKKGNSADEVRNQLRADKKQLEDELSKVEREIAKVDNNIRIDEQIEELREKQSEYEQSRADAENILFQLDLVGKKKNEMLSAEINSHFELVEFKLFDYQKNGSYKEVCVPQYKGKDLNVATNTGLETLMKIDIIKGLQKFYGQYYPVFLDGAECLSEDTRNSIATDCQIIYLSVNEDKELRIVK